MAKSNELTTKKFLTCGRKRYGKELKEVAAWIAHQLLDSENCDYENIIEELRDTWYDEFEDNEMYNSAVCEMLKLKQMQLV